MSEFDKVKYNNYDPQRAKGHYPRTRGKPRGERQRLYSTSHRGNHGERRQAGIKDKTAPPYKPAPESLRGSPHALCRYVNRTRTRL